MAIKGLVFSAAGFAGFLHLGALEILQQARLLEETTRFVGTSAGSIVASFAALGVLAREVLVSLLKRSLNLEELLDVSLVRFLDSLALSSGERLFQKVGRCLDLGWRDGEAKTFASLASRGRDLRIFGTALDTATPLVFDAEHTPSMPVLEAIRISCSIPFLMPFHMHQGQVCVDGGILRYYPQEELADLPEEQKLGVCVMGSERARGSELDIFAYLCMLFSAAVRLNPEGCSGNHTLCIKYDLETTLPGASQIAKMAEHGRVEMLAFLEKRRKAKVD